MSDSTTVSSPPLPPAAFEITAARRVLEAAAAPVRAVPLGLVLFAITVLALAATLVFVGRNAAAEGAGLVSLIAVGVVATGVLFALLIVLPLQLAVTARRRRVERAATILGETARRLRNHLAEIGYRAPFEVASDWVATADSRMSVQLVHDSAIAARWWRPAEGDSRVFVEPYLRREGAESALPVLPPVD